MTRVMLTAYYDDDTGELRRVTFSGAFKGENTLMRADVLRDLLFEIDAAYTTSAEAVQQEYTPRTVEESHE